LVGDLDKDGSLHNVESLGILDPAYVETLHAVQKAKTTSAMNLYEGARTRPKIGKTGWINRLSNLHRLRLIRKQRIGREYVFEAVS
jgi:hypothetical protein